MANPVKEAAPSVPAQLAQAADYIAKAQRLLADYLPPGGPSGSETISALLTLLDNAPIVHQQIEWSATIEATAAKREFSTREVWIALTGAEWFAMIASLSHRPLSAEGSRHLKNAGAKVTTQMAAESVRS